MPATLVDLLVRVVLLFLIAWIAVLALGKCSASLRALIWTLALGSALALPALSRTLPSFEVAFLTPAVTPIAGVAGAPPAPSTTEAEAPPAEFGPAVPPPTETTPVAYSPPKPNSWNIPWTSLATGFWAIGFVLVLGRILVSHLLLFRLSQAATEPGDWSWEELIGQVRAELRIRRPVGVRVSNAVQVPVVAGIFRPVLLLPVESAEWSTAERRDVALHELAHIARWDAVAQLVSQITCAVYWFVPLAWFGARQAAALRERACDDVVLNAGTCASAYARSLLNLARLASGAELEPAALAMARSSRIEERVMGILDSTTRRERVTGKAALALLLLAGGVIGAVAAVEPVRRGAAITPDEEIRWSEGIPTPPEPGETTPAITENRPPSQAAARDTNLFCSRGVKSNQNSIHEDNGERRWTVKVEGTDCKVEMRVEGRIEFNDDFTDVQSISRNGYFKLEVLDQGTRRELDIRPSNGSLNRVYKLNGEETPFDAEARAWFGAFLIALDRTTAIAVDIRLPRLLERGGAAAVLNETALMPSDYARGRYYSGLLQQKRLSPAELTRLLDQAATLTESDYYATELLKEIGRDGLDDEAERQAVLKMLKNMESDYYRSEVMRSVMKAGRPGPGEMNVMLEVVNSMESDYYQAEVLKQALESGELDAAQRAQVSRAAASMESGHYASEILKHLAGRGDLTENERRAFFEALSRIDNDYQRSEILGVLIREATLSQAEIEMILQATQGMESDYYRSEILGRLLTRSTLREADLISVVSSVRGMKSDYYKDEILRKVLRNDGATDRVRQAVIEAAETMGEYHRDEVRRAARAT
jgi:beta-lactamase regulating signal transducer with metallopeptidase domain